MDVYRCPQCGAALSCVDVKSRNPVLKCAGPTKCGRWLAGNVNAKRQIRERYGETQAQEGAAARAESHAVAASPSPSAPAGGEAREREPFFRVADW